MTCPTIDKQLQRIETRIYKIIIKLWKMNQHTPKILENNEFLIRKNDFQVDIPVSILFSATKLHGKTTC